MIKLKMKKSNTILTEKRQKYQHYRQVKLININILQRKKYCHQRRLIKQAKSTYYPLFEKQIKKIEEQENK